jgi:hypothetical protein
MNYYYYKNATLPKVVATSFSDDVDSISFDLKPVYIVPSLLSLTRTNTYTRTPGIESVVIQDKVKFSTLTSYEFALPSRNGIWTELSSSSNILTGKFTVGTISLNVRVHSTNAFRSSAINKTLNEVTYTRLGISMINPIIEDIITVTFN